MYVVIWEFKVRPECQSDFIDLCGHSGEWTQWFRKSPEYIGTDLLRSNEDVNLFLTVDKWNSKTAYDQFYNSDRDTFNRLDQKGETYTLEEKLIGAYEVV